MMRRTLMPVAAMMMFLSGCATATNYTYKSTAGAPVPAKAANVHVLKAVDRRTLPEPGVQGYVTNMLGSRVDTFKDPTDFMQVISNGLAEDLKNNGYRLIGTDDDLVIAIDVLETKCNVDPVGSIYKLVYDMKIRLTVKDRGETAFEQTYDGAYTDTYNLLKGPGVQYQKAMSDIFKNVVADLNEYLAS